MEYWKKIYNTRYFWSHLAFMDLKSRFRRSKLGLLWLVCQPFFLTIVMAVVFSTVFHQPLGDYLLYILSGMVVWDLLMSSVSSGGGCLLASEQYARQFKHPMTVYSLRYAVFTIITFWVELIALVIWTVVYAPENLLISFLTIPLTSVILWILSWELITLAGYANTKYRDYPQIINLVMQTVWYLSPVFFREEMFTSNPTLALFFRLNPLTHLLNLIRCPFLYGTVPAGLDYLFALGLIAVFGGAAWNSNRKNEDKIIFYF